MLDALFEKAKGVLPVYIRIAKIPAGIVQQIIEMGIYIYLFGWVFYYSISFGTSPVVDGCMQTVETIKLCFWKISTRNYRRGKDGILNAKVCLLSKNQILLKPL